VLCREPILELGTRREAARSCDKIGANGNGLFSPRAQSAGGGLGIDGGRDRDSRVFVPGRLFGLCLRLARSMIGPG
jgi:hypothetical protein